MSLEKKIIPCIGQLGTRRSVMRNAANSCSPASATWRDLQGMGQLHAAWPMDGGYGSRRSWLGVATLCLYVN